MSNRLADEPSLYLRQHANNPWTGGLGAKKLSPKLSVLTVLFLFYRLFFLPLVPCNGARVF